MRHDAPERQLRRRVLLALMLFVGIAVVYLLYNVSRFDRLTNVNAMDYAQVARHVMRGEGFTTSFIKPLSLVYAERIEGHPELTYPPLHILWTAGMMDLLGATDRAVSHASGLAFLLTVPPMFWLALRLFDWRTAVLATAVFGTHIANLAYAISGLETCLLMLEVTLLLLLMHQISTDDRPHRELVWVGLAGALMGALYLTKYVWLAAAIPVIVFLIAVRKERRLARVGVFVALTIAVATPWLVRNYNVIGDPFFTLRTKEMLGQTRAYPANSIYRTFSEHVPGYMVFLVNNPRAAFEKVRTGFGQLYTAFHGLGGIFVTPFFLVGVLVRLGNRRLEMLRYLVYGILVAVSLALIFVMASPRLIAPLGPVITILAVAFFWRLLDARLQELDIRTATRWAVVAVGLLLVLHMHPYLTEITPDEPWYSAEDDSIEQAMQQLASTVDEPVLTDSPWVVAWMADLPAVWLPQTTQDLLRLEDRYARFRWLVLTPAVTQMAGPEQMEEWAQFWSAAYRQVPGAEYNGFEPFARLGDNQEYILARRRPKTDG